MLLRPYLVWHTLRAGRSTARFITRRAPAGPMGRLEAAQFAQRKIAGAARGYAYMHAWSSGEAVEAYKRVYAEFIP